MKKQYQIISGAVAVLFVIAAGGAWHVYNHMQEQKQMLDTQMSEFQKNLPKEVKVSNVYEASLFSTTGTYTMTYNNGKINETSITEYTVQHGPGTWFGQDMQVHATTKLKGFLDPYLHYTGDFSTTDGTIAENGDMNLQVKHPAMNVVVSRPKTDEQLKIMLQPSGSILNLSRQGQNKIVYTLPALDIVTRIDTKDTNVGHLSNLKVERDFTMDNPQLGQLDFNIGAIEGKQPDNTVLFNAKNFNINSRVEQKANHYDFHGALSVGSVTSPNPAFQDKEVKAKLSYFVTGLDVKSINDFGQMIKKIQANEIQENPQTEAQFQQKITNIIKGGLSFGIDKFELQQGKDSVSVLQSVTIKPADKDGKFTLTDNTSMEFYLGAKGQVAQVAYPGVSKLLGVELKGADMNNFELSAAYANHKLSLNKQPADIPFVDYINDELKGLDVELGFSQPEADNANNGNATSLDAKPMTLDPTQPATTVTK